MAAAARAQPRAPRGAHRRPRGESPRGGRGRRARARRRASVRAAAAGGRLTGRRRWRAEALVERGSSRASVLPHGRAREGERGGAGERRPHARDGRGLCAKPCSRKALCTGSGDTHPALSLVAEEGADTLRLPASEALARAVAEEANAALRELGEPELSVSAVLDAIDLGAPTERGKPVEGARWILDPIDGTAGFLRGCGAQYVIGLALIGGEGEPLLGYMGMPGLEVEPTSTWEPLDPAASAGGAVGTMGVMLASRRGHGCTAHALHSTGGAWRVCVSSTKVLADGVVAISDHETPTWALPGGALPLLRRQCCGSLCKYALVAMGAADAFFQHPVGWASKLKTWDHAAGVACVEAAGGGDGLRRGGQARAAARGSCADDALSEGLQPAARCTRRGVVWYPTVRYTRKRCEQ